MLERSRRISTGLFNEVITSGFTLHSAHFSLRYVKSGPTLPFRITAAVPKKVESTAAGRNRVKRLIRSSLYTLLKEVPEGITAIVFAKAGIHELSKDERTAELAALIRRI